MITVLAAIDASPVAVDVLDAASAIAAALGAETRAIHASGHERPASVGLAEAAGIAVDLPSGDPVQAVKRATASPDVVLLVLGNAAERHPGRPVGRFALALMETIDTPVLLVPPTGHLPRPDQRPIRALLPLDGTPESATAVADAVHRLSGAGAEIIALHVFDPGSTPGFWDQQEHEAMSWASEFVARWCEQESTEMRLRKGSAPESVTDAALAEDVDLVAISWSQRLTPFRAGVVRRALETLAIPVLLVPASGPRASQEPGASDPSGPPDEGT